MRVETEKYKHIRINLWSHSAKEEIQKGHFSVTVPGCTLNCPFTLVFTFESPSSKPQSSRKP